MSIIYAIVFKDTNEVITEERIREIWPSYGHGSYRVAKKVYFTLGTAKSGFSRLPDQIKSELKIQEFHPTGNSIPGEVIVEEYQKRAVKKKAADERRHQKYEEEMQRHRLAMNKLKGRA